MAWTFPGTNGSCGRRQIKPKQSERLRHIYPRQVKLGFSQHCSSITVTGWSSVPLVRWPCTGTCFVLILKILEYTVWTSYIYGSFGLMSHCIWLCMETQIYPEYSCRRWTIWVISWILDKYQTSTFLLHCITDLYFNSGFIHRFISMRIRKTIQNSSLQLSIFPSLLLNSIVYPLGNITATCWV